MQRIDHLKLVVLIDVLFGIKGTTCTRFPKWMSFKLTHQNMFACKSFFVENNHHLSCKRSKSIVQSELSTLWTISVCSYLLPHMKLHTPSSPLTHTGYLVLRYTWYSYIQKFIYMSHQYWSQYNTWSSMIHPSHLSLANGYIVDKNSLSVQQTTKLLGWLSLFFFFFFSPSMSNYSNHKQQQQQQHSSTHCTSNDDPRSVHTWLICSQNNVW